MKRKAARLDSRNNSNKKGKVECIIIFLQDNKCLIRIGGTPLPIIITIIIVITRSK